MRLKIPRGAARLLFVALLLVLSCNKPKPEPTVTGRVLEYGTEIPIPDAKVTVVAWSGEFLGPSYSRFVGSTMSVIDGTYTLPEPEGVLVANAEKAGYFTDIDSEIVVTDNPVNDIHLSPHAWLRVTIKNESGAYGFGSSQLVGGILPQMKGEAITVKIMVKGNLDKKIIFFVLINETTSSKSSDGILVYDSLHNILPVYGEENLHIKVNPPGHYTTNLTIIY